MHGASSSARHATHPLRLCALPPPALLRIVQFLSTPSRLRVARCSRICLRTVQQQAAWQFAAPVPISLLALQSGGVPAASLVLHFAAIRCTHAQSMQAVNAQMPPMSHILATPLLSAAAVASATAPSLLATDVQAARTNSPPLAAATRLDFSFWLMFGLLSLVLVLAESSRGVVIPTLALYQQSLGGSTTFLGVLVAIFSVGRLGSSVSAMGEERHGMSGCADN